MHLRSRVSASASIKGTGFFLAKLEFPQLLELVQICSFFERVKEFVLSCCFSANPKYNYCAVQKRVNLVDLVNSFQTSIHLQNSASIKPRRGLSNLAKK